MNWPIHFSGDRWMFGIFCYWLGFSHRKLGATWRVIDAGFFKLMYQRDDIGKL